MAFTVHLHPHHIKHPVHGWLTPKMVAAHPKDCDCGHDLRLLVGQKLGTAGSFNGIDGHPEVEWPHHVEVDCSTGMAGYTRLSEEEHAVRSIAATMAMIRDAERERVAVEQKTKEKAANPAFILVEDMKQ